MNRIIKFILYKLIPRKADTIIYFFQSIIRIIKNNPIDTTNESEIVYKILKDSNCKIMFDVGAHTGGSLRPFAIDGWVIYAFEPDKFNRKDLYKMSKIFPNIRVSNKAISNEIKDDVSFYRSEISSGISTLSNFHVSHKETDKVSVTTIKNFCKINNIFSIDFLKIDTEGFDYFVLKGVPWDKFKPRLILCEFEDRKTKRLGYTFNEMANFLLDKGYKVVVSEWYPVEEYGKSHKWRNMKDYPCKLDDQILGHGNILAFADSNDNRKLNYIIKR